MSLEVSRARALAHPLRLRILSLLTGAAMSATELAREMGVTQSLASYHLRQLAAAGWVQLVETRTNRGGAERRYRYLPDEVPETVGGGGGRGAGPQGLPAFVEALAAELRRRALLQSPEPRTITDAEFWLDPQDWEQARREVLAVSTRLHDQARPPRTAGTVHVSASMVLFGLRDEVDPA